MTKIGIIGSKGRMGQAISAAVQDAGLTLSGGADQGEDIASLVTASDVLIDFSAPAALEANLNACVAAGKPIVIGTTGLEERHHYLIDDAAADIPVLQTGNTSLGVNMLAALVQDAASRLGEDWDIEITEMHHRHKVDAPSGTALLLGEAAAQARGIDLAATALLGRVNPEASALHPCAAAALRATTASYWPARASISPCPTMHRIAAYLHAAP